MVYGTCAPVAQPETGSCPCISAISPEALDDDLRILGLEPWWSPVLAELGNVVDLELVADPCYRRRWGCPPLGTLRAAAALRDVGAEDELLVIFLDGLFLPQ